jgi:hypothetical protein
MPTIQAVLPGVMTLQRRNMNVWEDDSVREAILKTQRRRLIVSGVLTEACVSFPALSTLTEGYEVYVVTDACGGITVDSHALALRRRQDDLVDPSSPRAAARLDAPHDVHQLASDRRGIRGRLWNRSWLRARDPASGLRPDKAHGLRHLT